MYGFISTNILPLKIWQKVFSVWLKSPCPFSYMATVHLVPKFESNLSYCGVSKCQKQVSYIWNARCSPVNLTRCCLERRWIFSCPAASFQWTFECSQKSLDSCHQDMSLRSLFHICITFEIWHSHLICVPFEHEKSLCCVRVLETPDQKSSLGFRELRGGWNVGPAQFAPGVNIAYNLIQPLLPPPLLFWLRSALHMCTEEIWFTGTVQCWWRELKGPFAIWKLFAG